MQSQGRDKYNTPLAVDQKIQNRKKSACDFCNDRSPCSSGQRLSKDNNKNIIKYQINHAGGHIRPEAERRVSRSNGECLKYALYPVQRKGNKQYTAIKNTVCQNLPLRPIASAIQGMKTQAQIDIIQPIKKIPAAGKRITSWLPLPALLRAVSR